VVTRLRTLAFSTVDLNAGETSYLDLQSQSLWVTAEKDLMSVFVLMNWLRMLKFLRIPAFCGPMVVSIMDTLTSSKVVVFEMVLFYVLLTFSFSYTIAFGTEIGAHRIPFESFVSMFLFLFGENNYDSMVESNKFFGRFFFAITILFTVFVLMNLLVGVLGEAYNSVVEVNDLRWNRLLTHMMIKTIPTRCKPKKGVKMEQEIEEDEERFDDYETTEKLISYEEGELDEMITANEEEEEDKQGVMLHKIEAMQEKLDSLEKTHEENIQLKEKISSLENQISSVDSKLDAILSAVSKPAN